MFIPMQGIINFRELGGLKTKDGHTVRAHRLFRCGELLKATPEDIHALEALGLGHIIDFRSPDEAEERPDVAVPGTVMHNFPALPPMVQPKDRIQAVPPPDATEMFPKIYRELAETEAAQKAYRQFFKVLLKAEGAPVLWHCRQGKDRTGVAAILLLSALGVSREDCIREYMLTNDYMQPVYEAYCQKESEPWKQEMMRVISLVYEDWLANFFTAVDIRYGGMTRYLEEVLSLTEDKCSILKEAYLV